MHPADMLPPPRVMTGHEKPVMARGFVTYKGVCIDLRGGFQTNTVSFSVFTPPGWMQWQATQ